MIKEVTGDILMSSAEAIAHGVAPNDDFKQGLALSLREKWPAMYKDFRHFCKTKSPKEGTLWSWRGAGGPTIISMFTQAAPPQGGGHPGKASMTNVNHCLRKLENEIKDLGIKSLALTKLSTGVGGLDWNEVKPEIERHLSETEVPVYVYSTYKKGVKAEL